MDFALDLNMGFIFVAVLGVLGAALIGGGIVAYRGSTAVMARSFSAASVVAGLVMWFIIASLTITSSSGTAPEPVVTAVKSGGVPTVSKQTFLHLLTAGDVEELLQAEAPLTTSYRDFKEMAEDTDPAQVVNIDSWFGLTIETPGSAEGMTFSLTDFYSPTSASAQFEKMRLAKKARPDAEASFGGSAYRVEINFGSIGSMLVVVKGDKLLSFNTLITEGRPALLPLADLEQLAELVMSRM